MVTSQLSDFGFRLYSQHDEDGILLFLFTLLGHGNRTFIELGCGSGAECNSANLSINYTWHGLLVDGQDHNIQACREFYANSPDTRYFPPLIVRQFVEPDNVNSLLVSQGISGEVGLLSIDLDGVDWWVWRELDVVSPRVVVVETPPIWGADESFTIPYSRGFVARNTWYYGASHLAYVRLASSKGYRLVGANKYGTNTFFVRDDLADGLPRPAVADCLTSHRARSEIRNRRPRALQLEWVRVDDSLLE